MILVTVGAQMPFDRLVAAVDRWVASSGYQDVFAQIGTSQYRPRHLRHERFLEPARFRNMCQKATLMVAHAGMGSIITALEFAKPILVMPRRGDLAETRNDHQIATARRFEKLGAVHVAMDEDDLSRRLDNFVNRVMSPSSGYAGCRLQDGSCTIRSAGCETITHRDLPCPHLLNGLRAIIHGMPVRRILTNLNDNPRTASSPAET